MIDSNESFDKMSKVFDTSFSATENIETDISIIENKKKELLERIKDKSTDIIKDQNWLDFEIKTLIVESRNVLHKLESDIKIGSSPRHFEVYAKLLESVLSQYKELRDMNRMIWEMERDSLNRRENPIDNNSKNKIEFTATQLSDFVKKIKDNNSLNSIDANFEVLDKTIEVNK